MKKKIPLPVIAVIVCFILGNLAASRLGKPQKTLIDSVMIQVDTVNKVKTIKIVINAKGN